METPTLAHTHKDLPPVAERVPQEPLILDLEEMGRSIGHHGGDIHTLIGRAKDVRLINVWGYARLVGYDQNLALAPDILKGVDVEEGRIFTFHLRKGHKWSDGHPFTAPVGSFPPAMPRSRPSVSGPQTSWVSNAGRVGRRAVMTDSGPWAPAKSNRAVRDRSTDKVISAAPAEGTSYPAAPLCHDQPRFAIM